jgi:hypothetical protein
MAGRGYERFRNPVDQGTGVDRPLLVGREVVRIIPSYADLSPRTQELKNWCGVED